MSPPIRARPRSTLFLLATLVLSTTEAAAQASEPGWTLTGGAITFRVGDANGWGVGPAASAQRRLRGRLLLDLSAATLLSSSGFYDFAGVSLDVGPAVALTRGRLSTTLGAGASTVVGGDSDGTGGAWIGGHVSAQGVLWLGSRLGLSVRGAMRVVTTGRTSPSIGAGLALRL